MALGVDDGHERSVETGLGVREDLPVKTRAGEVCRAIAVEVGLERRRGRGAEQGEANRERGHSTLRAGDEQEWRIDCPGDGDGHVLVGGATRGGGGDDLKARCRLRQRDERGERVSVHRGRDAVDGHTELLPARCHRAANETESGRHGSAGRRLDERDLRPAHRERSRGGRRIGVARAVSRQDLERVRPIPEIGQSDGP